MNLEELSISQPHLHTTIIIENEMIHDDDTTTKC